MLFIGFTLIMGMGLSSAFLPIFAEELDPSGVLAGFVVSAWFLRIFMEIPSGIISDRIGRPRLLIAGTAMGTFGALLCALTKSIYILILGRAVWGLGAALFFMSSMALILDLFDSKMRGRALGIAQGIELIGSFIGAPIGAFVAVSLGSYNIVFYFASGLILSSFILASISKDLKKIKTEKNSNSYLPVKEVLSGFKNWAVIVVCTNTFFRILITQGIFQTIFILYLNQEIKLSVEIIAAITTARAAGHIATTLTSGYISDKIGGRQTIIVGMLLEGASLYAITAIFRFELFLLVGLFGGFGEGMIWTSLLVLLSESVPAQIRGGVIGLYRTFMDLGGLTGPIFFMFIFKNVGAIPAFHTAIAILTLNILLLATVRTRKPIS